MGDEDKIKALYNTISKNYDVGGYDDFATKLQDSAKRKAFYDFASKSYDLGDYNSFEGSVKKKVSGIPSGASVSPTPSPSSAEPKYEFGKGSLVGTPGTPIQMPGQSVDQQPHEDDPINEALKGHRTDYTKALNEFNNSGISQRQSSESTGKKIRPQQMIVGGDKTYGENVKNKLTGSINKINDTYDAVSNHLFPDVDKAEEYLKGKSEKNKGELPQNNETVNVAIKKVNDYKDKEKSILGNFSLVDAAVNEARKNNPALDKQIQQIKEGNPHTSDYNHLLPPAMLGRLVDNFVKDKDVQSVVKHNPDLQEEYSDLSKNVLTKYPEYGANVVANELSRAREAEGKNNAVANFAFGHSDYMDKLAEKLYKNDPQKLEIYNNVIKNDINSYIDTPGVFDRAVGAIKHSFDATKRSVNELAGTKNADLVSEDLKREGEEVNAEGKGLHQYSSIAGDMLGTIAYMAAGGEALGAAGVPANIADKTMVGLTFFSDEKAKARTKFTDPLAQNLSAGLMTGAYMAAGNAVPSGKLSKVMNGIRPEINEITEKLANGSISKEIAKSQATNALEKALKFGKAVGKQELKGTTEMVAVTAFNQALDKTLGLSDKGMEQAHPSGELADVAKTMLIGNLIPSIGIGIGGIKSKSFTKDALYEMAENPKRFQSVLHDQMLTDPSGHSKIENKLTDLDHLVRTKAELDAHTDLTTDQKKQYVLHDYNEKLLTQKADGITNEFLKKKIEDQIKKSQAIKENIFKGKGTDVLPQEDHLTAKEYQKVSDIKTDEELFNHFVDQKKEGFKTTLQAAADMEDKKAGVKAGLEYMTDKAVENPKRFREIYGDELTTKMLDRAPTEKLESTLNSLLDTDSENSAVPILDKLIEQRYEKGEVSKPTESKEPVNEEIVEAVQPAKESKRIIEENEWHRGVNKNNENQGDRFYSSDKDTAHDYAINKIGDKPKMTKLNKEDHPENPLVVGSKEDLAEQLGIPENEIFNLNGDFDKKAKEYAQSKGHDAIVYESGSMDNPEMHIFEKIKPKANAIPERSTETPTMGEASENSGKMGARISGAEEPPGTQVPKEGQGTSQEDLTGITHQQMDETAREFGLETYHEDPETVKEWDDAADKRIEKNPNAISELLGKLRNGDQPDKVEQRMMIKYIADLKAKIRENPSDELLTQLKRAKDLSNIVGGREVAKSLRARQGSVPVEDTLGDFMIRDMDSQSVDVLTEAQKKQNIKEYEEITKANEALKEKVQKLEAAAMRLKAEKKVKESGTKKTTEKRDFSVEKKDILKKMREDLLKAAKGGSGLTSSIPGAAQLKAIAPHVAKYVKILLEEGYTKLDEIVKSVHEAFKETGASERDIHAIIAGEYNEKKATRSELARKAMDLKVEAGLINKLERLEAGEAPTTEKRKIERNKEITELRKKIKDFEKETANAAKFPKQKKTPEEVALQSLKTRTINQISEIEKQLQTGDFSKEEPKDIKLDKEALELKDRLVKLKQDRELRILKQEYANRTRYERWKDRAIEVLNIPRTLMSSMDYSAPLRQGLVASVAHPGIAAKAAVEMFRQSVSQKRFDRWFHDLRESPEFKVMEQSGLYVSDPHDPRLSAKEEAFMNNLAEKIPLVGALVKGSERAYVGYLNKMRVDLFNRFSEPMAQRGETVENSPQKYKALADYINNSTGRGKLGESLEKASPVLNSILFSPRLIASRINLLTNPINPRFYQKVPKEIRVMYAKDMLKFIGTGLSILALAKLNGAQVEDDPRSSDFGKIKSGDTRWDIWGGFQQYVRLIAQVASGEKKSTVSGKLKELNGKQAFGESRSDVLGRFVRGKLAPVPSIIADITSGRKTTGEDVTLKDEAVDHLLPLLYSDIHDAMKDNGVSSLFTVGIPSTFGVGVQTYSNQKKKH